MARTKLKAPPPPPAPPPIPDPLGDRLVELGFAPSRHILELNHSLTAPYDEQLPAPWDLPSRLFRFPIVTELLGDGTRRIGLTHPLLVDHPFVQRVSAALEIPLDPQGAPNDYGYNKAGMGTWWHACDLIEGNWRDLLDTRRFTTDHDIMRAVGHALWTAKRLTVANARFIMSAVGSPEPSDRQSALRHVAPPSRIGGEKGAVYWAINDERDEGDLTTWNRILGIEAGWFAYDRGGYLHWTDAGRDRFAAGATTILETKTGQFALAF